MATCGNGRRTAGTIAIKAHRPTARLGHPEIAVAVSSAAVHGSTIRGTSARPAAAGSTPSAGATTSAFGWGGRLQQPDPGYLRPNPLVPYRRHGSTGNGLNLGALP